MPTPWTKRNGPKRNRYLPITFTDDLIGDIVPLDVWDSDLMDDKLVTQILSLDKPPRDGRSFHLTSDTKQCYGMSPGGAHRVNVELGNDNLLRIPHAVRTGPDSACR